MADWRRIRLWLVGSSGGSGTAPTVGAWVVVMKVLFFIATVAIAIFLLLLLIRLRYDRLVKQHQGIGSLLVKTGLEIAEQMRSPMVIVLGEPKFYSRFEFKTAINYGIKSPFYVT